MTVLEVNKSNILYNKYVETLLVIWKLMLGKMNSDKEAILINNSGFASINKNTTIKTCKVCTSQT